MLTSVSSARPSRGRARRVSRSSPPTCIRPSCRAWPTPGSTSSTATRRRRCEAAWEATTIVTTGTASGKSLCFNLPTLDVLCTRRQGARALPLPDEGARPGPGARAATPSGCPSRCAPRSTTATRRARSARRSAGASNLVLTNPDMLHVGILPNHARVGATSSPTSRSSSSTRRTSTAACSARTSPTCCAGCGASPPPTATEPRFLLASATIANPVELAERLTGLEDVRARRRATARPARGARSRCGTRRVIDEALQLRAQRAGRGGRAARRARARGRADDLLHQVAQGGRAGRRSIVATSCAEATRARRPRRALPRRLHAPAAPRARGAADERRAARRSSRPTRSSSASTSARSTRRSCVTFPGTVASLRQMWGRAGRRGRGLAVYVAGEDALDQFFCRHPDEFLERPVEAAILDHENEPIHLAHLLCAAHEGPLARGRRRVPRPALAGLRRAARRRRASSSSAAGSTCCASPRTTRRRACRCARPRRDTFAVVDVSSGELLGHGRGRARATRPSTTARSTCTSGAPTRSRELDLDARRALVAPFDGNWYTQPKRETDTEIERLLDRRDALGVTLSFGARHGHRAGPRLPAQAPARPRGPRPQGARPAADSFTTQALWYELGRRRCSSDFPLELLLGALHAAEHAQIAVLPLLAMCDRWDIGGLSTNAHPQTGGPTIFIYDGHPGGVGITRQGFRSFDAARRRRAPADRRVPVRVGLPVVRAVAEVRQPQRAAVARRARSR